MKKIRYIGFALMIVSILMNIFCSVTPNIVEKQVQNDYEKYYQIVKDNTKITKKEIKTECIDVVEEININTQQSERVYSFDTDYEVYDNSETAYETGQLYDATQYKFKFDFEENYEIDNFIVLKDATFNFNETTEKYLTQFTENMIKETTEDLTSSMRLTVLILTGFLLLLTSILLLVYACFGNTITTFDEIYFILLALSMFYFLLLSYLY
jgi:hypothetical protein